MLLQPTRTTLQPSNILDLFLTSYSEKVTSLTYLQGLGDHNVIHATLTVPARVNKFSDTVIKPYDKGNYLQINKEPCSYFDEVLQPQSSTRSVEDKWSLLRSTLDNLVDKFNPTKPLKSNPSSPQFNNALKYKSDRKKMFIQESL